MDCNITQQNDLRAFAERFIDESPPGKAIGLSGDLGAGKTTFVRLLIEIIGNRMGILVPRVTSPTYIIQVRYPQLQPCIEHFDLYRLDKADHKALTEIGYYESLEYVKEHNGFLFVEWPEKVLLREELGLSEIFTFSIDSAGRFVKSGR